MYHSLFYAFSYFWLFSIYAYFFIPWTKDPLDSTVRSIAMIFGPYNLTKNMVCKTPSGEALPLTHLLQYDEICELHSISHLINFPFSTFPMPSWPLSSITNWTRAGVLKALLVTLCPSDVTKIVAIRGFSVISNKVTNVLCAA